MSPGNERRPGVGTEATTQSTASAGAKLTSTIPRDDDIAAQLRRRRAASYRCPPLDDGRADPIDKPRPRRAIVVRAIGRNTVELTGCDRAVRDAITTLCVKYQRAPAGGAWLVPQAAADDVMALLEVRGYRLAVTL
jgi:hypothetical protein